MDGADPESALALPVEDALDLHPFRPDETSAVVTEYVAAAAQKGFREVRLVHGRGIGVQRAIVRGALERSAARPLVRGRDARKGRMGRDGRRPENEAVSGVFGSFRAPLPRR